MTRDPKVEVEVSAHSRSLRARLREARAKFATFGAELKKHVFGKELVEKGFWGKAGAQMVGNLGTNAVMALGGALLDQGKAVMDFEDRLVRLQITARKTPEEMRAFADSVRRSSNETGINATQILAGAQAYVALTGDMDGAAASARQWSRVAQATNSDVKDIAGTAAALKQQMKIEPGQMEAAFAALTIQGKEGAIELKDLAAELSSIAPMWAEFKGGKGLSGLKELGATLQVGKRGFGGDASETVTGLQSLLVAIQKNAKRFESAKIKVFDKDPKTGVKTMRSVLDIVDSIGKSKLVKDPTKLEKAFGRVEAYRFFLQMRNGREDIRKLVEAAGDVGVIGRDLDTYLASPAGKIKQSFEEMKNRIAEAFTPERIEMFAAGMQKVLGFAVSIVDVLGKIPDAIDVEGAISKAASEHYTEGSSTMTSQQKYDRAQKLLREAKDLEANADQFGHGGDYDRARARGARDAAGRLAAGAREDSWFMPDRGPQNPFVPQKPVDAGVLAKAFAKELGPMLRQFLPGTTVKIDGEKVTRTVKDSRDAARR
jgi:TP901 family phage tail tape measure protein